MPNWDDASQLQAMGLRKSMLVVEDTLLDGAAPLAVPVRRVAGLAVLLNPCVRTGSDDLAQLSELAPRIGAHLMKQMTALMHGEVVGYIARIDGEEREYQFRVGPDGEPLDSEKERHSREP